MPRNPAPAKGRQPPVPADRRTAIIERTKEQIMEGKTLKQIADEHGIGKATLKLWLHALGDEYKDLRTAWLDNMLAEATEAIDDEKGDALALARAREKWRYATWYAERRDPFRYGVKGDGNQQVAVNVYVNRDGAMTDVTPRLEGDES